VPSAARLSALDTQHCYNAIVTIEPASELSEREREIVRLVATGATNAQIARELFISPNTVKVHLRNIFAKLGVDSRTEATMVAVRQGWVSLPETGAPPAAAPVAPAAPAVAGMPWVQRVFLLAAAAACLALLLVTWPREGARACTPSPVSDSCALPGDTIADSRWAARVNMPTARGRLALVALPDPRGPGGRLAAIGGETDSGVTGAVEIFDPASNTWKTGAAKPVPVANIGAALVNGRVYVPGGLTAGRVATNVLEIYDPAADAWQTGAPMPEARFGYALAVWANRLYLFGGSDGQHYTAQTLIYDVGANTWTTGAALPTPRAWAAAGTVQNQLLVVGGYDETREYDLCDRYDALLGSWAPCAPLDLARGGLGAAILLDRLYVFGGGWTRVLAFSERYDLQTDTWARFDTPLTGEWRNVAVAALDGDIFVAGGYDGRHYLGVFEQYQAVYKSYLPTTKH
jgi:DNA-binding CsgD family transcriptional regulator